jgi:hypothetical protein
MSRGLLRWNGIQGTTGLQAATESRGLLPPLADLQPKWSRCLPGSPVGAEFCSIKKIANRPKKIVKGFA